MQAHVFIDSSNLFIGAMRASEEHEPEAPWLAVRLYYRNLFKLIESDYDVRSRFLAGSVPPGNEDLWDHARRGGYNTDLLRKVETAPGKMGEQAVDELLHLKIANALLDHAPPQTLVLATGDGAISDFGTSFVQQAERALRQGWNVDVWSWKSALSGNFARLSVPSGLSVTIEHLDQHYKSITFVKKGAFRIGTSLIELEGRVVARL